MSGNLNAIPCVALSSLVFYIDIEDGGKIFENIVETLSVNLSVNSPVIYTLSPLC